MPHDTESGKNRRTMKALVYRKSIPRYAMCLILAKLWRKRFFQKIAPMGLKEIPFTPAAHHEAPEWAKGWLTLKMRMCGICGSDLGLLRGAESFLLEPYGSFPAVLGHETLAEVEDAPADSGFARGDRVVVEPVLHCAVRGLDLCPQCAKGDYNLCENFLKGPIAPGSNIGYNADVGGGMAEYMLAPPVSTFKVPENISDETAVLADSLASALQPALDNFPEDGDKVVVYGAGIIGQHLIRCLRALGSAAKIIAVARRPFQRDLALAGGADLVLMSPSRKELGQTVGATYLPTSMGGGNLEGGADVFFDCVGSGRTLQEGLLTLRGKGRYVMVGTSSAIKKADVSSLWFREIRAVGTMCYAWGAHKGQKVRTYEMALDFLAKSRYPTDGLLTHTFRLEEYAKAFRTVFDKGAHKSMKVAFDLR